MTSTTNLVRAANDLDRLRLDDVNKFLDLNDKVAVLAVLAEQKPSYALGLWADEMDVGTREGLSAFAEGWHLQVLSTKQPAWALVDGVPEYATKTMEAVKPLGDVLWLFNSEQVQSSQIEQACRAEIDVGLVLGYPVCCVEEHRKLRAEGICRFYRQFIKQYRPRDKAGTIRLISEDPRVDMEDVRDELEILNRTVGRSFERFSFVSHIACRACLGTDSSPTRELNEQYRSVAELAGSHFYKRILAVRPSTNR